MKWLAKIVKRARRAKDAFNRTVMVRVQYIRDGKEYEGSIEQLLVYSGSASTRMMKYLIALTTILVRKGILGCRDLEDLARAYQVDVQVKTINHDAPDVENAIEGTVIE